MKKVREIKIDIEKIHNKKLELISKLSLQDSSKLLSHEEASKVYSDLKPKKFGPIDIVLLLLGIIPDKPIKGKTMMMKQTFLTEKELSLDLQDLEFVGHRFGPHSFLIENVLRNMEFLSLIKKNGSTKNPRYYLAKNGAKRAKELLKELNPEETKQLREFRISCDEMGTDGILRFVYNNYHDYIDESIIKRRYFLVDWEKKK